MTAASRILDAAAELYAERGFETSLAEIARKARVTPQDVRRCFGGKRALVGKVIARLFESRWREEWGALLADRSIPLAERLVRFYVDYRRNAGRTSTRLWTRAGLMGVHGSGAFSATLAKRILIPVVGELRHEAGLPSLARRRVTRAELEIVQMLHGCIAFPNTRRYVFDMDVHGDARDLTAMMVRVWLAGAVPELRRMHRAPRQ